MADERFERIVRSPLEFTFNHDANGQFAQQIVKEIEGKSNLLMDATYMPTSEDSRHRGRRSEELKDSAQAVASDQGHVFSEGTHDVEYTTEIGMVADGCKFNDIQEENAPNVDVAARERQDISDTIESLNRKDAFFTVYGDMRKNPKEWNGFTYYTRKLTDVSEFEKKYYAGLNPFEGNDLCLTLDNQKDATKALEAGAGDIFSSIYAVVWGTNYVSKLYPKNSMSYGIDTKVSAPSTIVYENKETGKKEWMEDRYISFKKSSGVNVHDRFGLIRIANINFDKMISGSKHDVNEEYERLCKNMAFVEEILSKKGVANMVKFYAPVPLIRKMREARAFGQAPQSNIIYSIGGVEQAGQVHGIMAENFYLNDNYLITPEFQMLQTEKFVGLEG